MKSSRNREDYRRETEEKIKNRVFDYVVVGGGVAGIFTAEALSRTGAQVLLVEKNPMLASESSGEQHGWGQFGYLYINAPDPGVAQACLKNVDLLLNSYDMPGRNLIADEKGELTSLNPNSDESWYRSDPIYYYYPEPDEAFLNLNAQERKEWNNKLKNVLVRTKAINSHKWSEKGLPDDLLENADKMNEGDSLRVTQKAAKKWMKKTAARFPHGSMAARLEREKRDINLASQITIESHDRPMRSQAILTSVESAFLNNGGDELMNTEIKGYEVKNGLVELKTGRDETITAKKVIFTAGGGLHKIPGSNVKTVLSPLLVVSPPVCDRNLVYLTPKNEFTINHLHHVDPVSGKAYSIIGNGDGIDPENEQAQEASKKNILAQAEKVFPRMREIPDQDKTVYFGYKTEFKKEGSLRNYHFAIAQLDDHGQVFGAVPGKFTFGPSLAAEVCEKLTGQPVPAPRGFNERELKEYQTLMQTANVMANAEAIGSNVAPGLLNQIGQPSNVVANTEAVKSNVPPTLPNQIVSKTVGSDGLDQKTRGERNKLYESRLFSLRPSNDSEFDVNGKVEVSNSPDTKKMERKENQSIKKSSGRPNN